MRDQGLANATTKLIAAAAGYSEAMLYKHFADKQELFLAVLEERAPAIRMSATAAGHGDLAQNLSELVEQLMSFFAQTFPIAGSVFGSPELLARHREGVTSHGRGPRGPLLAVTSYLEAERAAGRLAPDADIEAAAQLLVGSAFHQGFLAAFDGLDHVPDATATASRVAQAVLPALQPPSTT